jgi:PleD family two-component response regulator
VGGDFRTAPDGFDFSGILLLIALAFGVFLWRTNWRERQLQALEQAVIAFQRQLDAPALRILGAVRGLQNRNSVRLDETAEKFAAEINMDAALIDELAKKYLEFSRLVQAGDTAAGNRNAAFNRILARRTKINRQIVKSKTKKTILLADDDINLRRVLEFQLTEAGYKVFTAQDGAEAFEIFTNNDFDCVISDLRMPKLSGLELLEKSKRRTRDSGYRHHGFRRSRNGCNGDEGGRVRLYQQAF